MAGNANSGKRREAKFYAALNLALSDEKEHPQALRKIAGNLVKQAMDGEQWAIREIADRLDGKPAQAVTGEDGGPIEVDVTQRHTGVPRPEDFKDPAILKAIVDAMNASKA